MNDTDHPNGRVEVFDNSQWRGVCGRDWTTSDDKVVCDSLGYWYVNNSTVKGNQVCGKIHLKTIETQYLVYLMYLGNALFKVSFASLFRSIGFLPTFYVIFMMIYYTQLTLIL